MRNTRFPDRFVKTFAPQSKYLEGVSHQEQNRIPQTSLNFTCAAQDTCRTIQVNTGAHHQHSNIGPRLDKTKCHICCTCFVRIRNCCTQSLWELSKTIAIGGAVVRVSTMLHLLLPAGLLLVLLLYLLNTGGRWEQNTNYHSRWKSGCILAKVQGLHTSLVFFTLNFFDDENAFEKGTTASHPLDPLFLFSVISTTFSQGKFLQTYSFFVIYQIVRNGIRDPVNRLWDLYKRHNRGGLLRIRAFNIELVGIILNTSRAFSSLKVYIGDFKMLKEVFNNPDAQGRAIPQIHEVRYCVLCM